MVPLDPVILADITKKKIETLLKFDKATVERDFGHFAHVLIDVDLSKPIKSLVHLECEEAMFEAKMVSEKVSSFCKACGTIGHILADCRMLNKVIDGENRNRMGKEATDSVVEPTTVQRVEEKDKEGSLVVNDQAERVKAPVVSQDCVKNPEVQEVRKIYLQKWKGLMSLQLSRRGFLL